MKSDGKHYNPDYMARHLSDWATLARSMPPAFDGAAISYPVGGPEGQIARILPGRGLLLNRDLKDLKITHTIPHVFERSATLGLMDLLANPSFKRRSAEIIPPLAERLEKSDELRLAALISSYDQIAAARVAQTGAPIDWAVSLNSINTSGLTWATMFQAGGFPAAGVYSNIPGGAVMTKSSTGAWNFLQQNPTGSNSAYLLGFSFVAAQQINMAMMVDLLVAADGISANLSTSQTVNSAALTRYTNGAGVMMTFHVTTALGATASNLTVTYTNQAGTASRSTGAVAMSTSALQHRLQPSALGPFMSLQSGDYGAQSVQTAQLSAAMGAGTLALNLYYPLEFLPGIAANIYAERDFTLGMTTIAAQAVDAGNVLGCLTLYILPNTSSTGQLTGTIRTCQG